MCAAPGWTDVAPSGVCPCSVTALTLTPTRRVSLQQLVSVTRTDSTPERSRSFGNVKYAAGHTLGRPGGIAVTYTTSPFVSTFAQFPATTFTLPPGQTTSVSAAERIALAATAAKHAIATLFIVLLFLVMVQFLLESVTAHWDNGRLARCGRGLSG